MTRDTIAGITGVLTSVGVVFGIGVAFYELYVNDRSSEIERQRRSYEVASRIFQYESMKDFIDVAIRYGSESRPYARQNDRDDRDAVLRRSFPILMRIAEIDTCLEQGLCDSVIVLAVACSPILGVGREFERIDRNVDGVSQIVKEKPLRRMLERCAKA